MKSFILHSRLSLSLLLLLTVPAVVQAQFNYTTSNGNITITSYTGTSTVVTIPSAINSLPVTCIGDIAFSYSGLVSVTIPDSVTSIGVGAFFACFALASVRIPDSVTAIGGEAFEDCASLTNVTIGNGLTSIGYDAFAGCIRLAGVAIGKNVTTIAAEAFKDCFWYSSTSIIMPSAVSSIGDSAFAGCDNLTAVYFLGNAPAFGASVFAGDVTIIYYLPGTTGWGQWSGSLPTAPWLLPHPLILDNSSSFGVRTNGFGFIISWATNIPVVVEACMNLANHSWSPISTNTLTSGASYFSDSQWTNYQRRFYRLRSP